MKPSVLIGLSGGVDSAMSAAILKESGYDVFGVTLVMFDAPSSHSENASITDAQTAAQLIGIHHFVVEAQEPFRQIVIDYFADEYAHGRTPNPCIICNRFVKFEQLLRIAKERSIDKIATGHYARIKYCEETGRYAVLKGLDQDKDQSYFLFRLSQEQLASTMLPLGDRTKSEVRDLAVKLGLSLADKRESQEVCFVSEQNYPHFLRDLLTRDESPGPIVDKSGHLLGMHKGIIHYTVGQRRGLGVAAPAPLYILEIIPDENKIIVGYEAELARMEIETKDCVYMPFETLEKPTEVKVKIRYRSPDQPGTVIPKDDGATIRFADPVYGVAPGQSAVFYDGDMLIGGGTIT